MIKNGHHAADREAERGEPPGGSDLDQRSVVRVWCDGWYENL